MKRILFLACIGLLVVSNSAEARRRNHSYNTTYAQPARVTPVTYAAPTQATPVVQAAPVVQASYSASPTPPTTAVQPAKLAAVSYSTQTAQGVANIMAARGQVGHFGGNPGYEGCGCGATPAAAYNICCYSTSGMATVDVGYARSANGMWFCCRRYR